MRAFGVLAALVETVSQCFEANLVTLMALSMQLCMSMIALLETSRCRGMMTALAGKDDSPFLANAVGRSPHT